MMETRCDEAYFNINWEDILNEEKLIKLGRQAVPAIDGSKCSTWDIITEMKSCGLGLLFDRDWAKEPIVIRNQSLFTMHAGFVENVSSVSTGLRLILNIRKFWKLRGQDRVYGPISSFDTKFTKNSSAWSFNLDGLVEYKMPNALTLTKLDGIFSFGPWFTAGHIETGGDDSITSAPVGKKLMLIAKRGRASRRLESLFTSWTAIADCLTKSPSKLMKNNVKFFITYPDALMIQPALCAHTVVTMRNGPALVVGFEGRDESDLKRRKQVLNYYPTGLGVERRKVLLKKYSGKQALSSLSALKKTKTALFEHSDCFQYDDGRSASSTPARDIKVPRRKRRMLFLSRVRAKYNQKAAKRQGTELILS